MVGGRKVKAQSSAEYLLVFIAAITVITLAFYLLLSSASVNSLDPQSCSFDGGITCAGIAVASNNTNTMIGFIGTDSQDYEIENVSIAITAGGAKALLLCSPSIIKPGMPFMCIGSLSKHLPVGYSLESGLLANLTYCPMDGCSQAVKESFVGRANTYVSSYKVPKFGVVLTAPIFKPSNTIGISVDLDLFGHNFSIEQANIQGSNVSSTAYLPYAYFVNITPSSQANIEKVNVSFAGYSANETFALNTQNVKNLYCKHFNPVANFLLTLYYSRFISYPSNFSVLTCPLYNNTVYCIGNNVSYFSSLQNAEKGVWQEASGIGINQRIIACISYAQAIYCFSNATAYVSLITNNSLGAWSRISYPLLINMTSC